MGRIHLLLNFDRKDPVNFELGCVTCFDQYNVGEGTGWQCQEEVPCFCSSSSHCHPALEEHVVGSSCSFSLLPGMRGIRSSFEPNSEPSHTDPQT